MAKREIKVGIKVTYLPTGEVGTIEQVEYLGRRLTNVWLSFGCSDAFFIAMPNEIEKV